MPVNALIITRWPDYLYIVCLFRSSIAYGALCGIALRPWMFSSYRNSSFSPQDTLCWKIQGHQYMEIINVFTTKVFATWFIDKFYLVSVSGDNPSRKGYMIYWNLLQTKTLFRSKSNVQTYQNS